VLEWQFVPDAGVLDWRTPVRDAITAWRPKLRDAMEAAWWAGSQRRVREVVGRADPLTAKMAAHLAAALWQIALFCRHRQLGDTERTWLDEQTLTLFTAVGRPDLAPATRAAIASRVRSLANPVPVSGRDVFTPYTAAELAALWQAAGEQKTPERSRNARIMLALGAGAGLTTSEIAQVRAHDVRPAGAAVVVAVRGRRQRRMVIVRRAFEHTLAEAAHAHTGHIVYLLAPGCYSRTGIVHKITGSLQLPDNCPRPQPRRLRANWLKELAEAHVPLPVLAAAAGVTDLAALTRLLRHLKRPDVDQAADQLRNG
jgi:hypothetical protein